MSEPIKTEQTGEPGRPSPSEEQFDIWLKELKPYLESACSIFRACNIAGIPQHYDVILRKYNIGDWFSKKVDAYRSTPGEEGNEAEVRVVKIVLEKLKKNETPSHEEYEILKHFNEKHRTAQPFFVTKIETSTSDPNKVGRILDNIEQANKTDYKQVAVKAQEAINQNGQSGSEAQGQVVETQQPIQDQGQAGTDNNLSA